MDSLLYLVSDVMLVVACGTLHVTMMRRYHARADLGFQRALLSLAVTFAACGAVFAFDVVDTLFGWHVYPAIVRFCAAGCTMVAAVVVSNPKLHALYVSLPTIEQERHHLNEIERLCTKLKERERDGAGNPRATS